MKFEELSLGWKTLSVMGIIFTVICIILGIIMILMFETDLIPWPALETPSSGEIEDEFADFLKEFEFGIPEENTQYKHPILDFNGDPVLDLLHIEIYK